MMLLRGWLVVMLMMMAACGRGPEIAGPPPQSWGKVMVRIESRPIPPRVGMNEFLVIGTEASGKPAWNMMVTLRTGASDDWRQAIQDGESGVYRKALPLGAGEQTLYVRLQRGTDETVLEFPFKVD